MHARCVGGKAINGFFIRSWLQTGVRMTDEGKFNTPSLGMIKPRRCLDKNSSVIGFAGICYSMQVRYFAPSSRWNRQTLTRLNKRASTLLLEMGISLPTGVLQVCHFHATSRGKKGANRNRAGEKTAKNLSLPRCYLAENRVRSGLKWKKGERFTLINPSSRSPLHCCGVESPFIDERKKKRGRIHFSISRVWRGRREWGGN